MEIKEQAIAFNQGELMSRINNIIGIKLFQNGICSSLSDKFIIKFFRHINTENTSVDDLKQLVDKLEKPLEISNLHKIEGFIDSTITYDLLFNAAFDLRIENDNLIIIENDKNFTNKLEEAFKHESCYVFEYAEHNIVIFRVKINDTKHFGYFDSNEGVILSINLSEIAEKIRKIDVPHKALKADTKKEIFILEPAAARVERYLGLSVEALRENNSQYKQNKQNTRKILRLLQTENKSILESIELEIIIHKLNRNPTVSDRIKVDSQTSKWIYDPVISSFKDRLTNEEYEIVFEHESSAKAKEEVTEKIAPKVYTIPDYIQNYTKFFQQPNKIKNVVLHLSEATYKNIDYLYNALKVANVKVDGGYTLDRGGMQMLLSHWQDLKNHSIQADFHMVYNECVDLLEARADAESITLAGNKSNVFITKIMGKYIKNSITTLTLENTQVSNHTIKQINTILEQQTGIQTVHFKKCHAVGSLQNLDTDNANITCEECDFTLNVKPLKRDLPSSPNSKLTQPLGNAAKKSIVKKLF